MKTTKLILAVAFFAFSTMVFSQSARPDQNQPVPVPNLSVKITLQSATQMDGLVKAMFKQLDPRLILQGDNPIVVVKVKYGHITYTIWGKKAEWKNFFSDPSGIRL